MNADAPTRRPGPPVIPDFELIRPIGQGAYGEVWLARGLTGVYRAIKVVWRDRFADAGPFEREFSGLKRFTAMSRPEAGQLALLHVGQNEQAGFFYYVMELADDVDTGDQVNPAKYRPLTLRELRARRGRLPAAECVTFGVELAWALADRILVLGPDGQPVAQGTPRDVVASAGPALVAAGIWLPPEIDSLLGVVPPVPPVVGPAGRPVVTADGVSYAYGDASPAVDHVDLEVGSGERVTLVGPNGGGKSTLGRLLGGLLRPSAGQVRLRGDRPDRLAPADLARRAGYLFQDPEQQFLAGTVLDEVFLGLRRDERARAGPLMASLGLPLDRFAPRSPYDLSGGEQRRLSLACVLIEPTYGQDRSTYRGLLDALQEHLDAGAAVLVATHDERLTGDLGGRCLRMANGALEAMA